MRLVGRATMGEWEYNPSDGWNGSENCVNSRRLFPFGEIRGLAPIMSSAHPHPRRCTMRILVGALVLALASTAAAAVKTKEIEYDHDGTKLKGILAFDDAAKGKHPGVLVFHEWWGLNDYAKKR